jgi:hypothetical protein
VTEGFASLMKACFADCDGPPADVILRRGRGNAAGRTGDGSAVRI